MSNPKLLTGRRSECGACYMVTTVLYGRRPLFQQRRLASIAATELARAADQRAVLPLAWVVTPDHVHWLFELRARVPFWGAAVLGGFRPDDEVRYVLRPNFGWEATDVRDRLSKRCAHLRVQK